MIYHLFSIYLRTLKHLDHCSHSNAKKRENVGTFPISGTPLPPVWEPYVCERKKCILGHLENFWSSQKCGESRNGWPGGTTCVKNCNKCFCLKLWNLADIVICDIWLKLWYLADIVILWWYCDIWLILWYYADIVIFGWYCNIWLILLNMAEIVNFG